MDEGFDKIEVASLVDDIKENISTDVAETVELRIEGLSFTEIGERLNISKQAVEQRLRKHRDRIIELYQGA